MKRGCKLRKDKKGLSPVIATVLLVALVVIIALLIFVWARRFVGEAVQKQGASVEQKCGEINLDVKYSGNGEDELYVVNRGNIPIYGLDVIQIFSGDKESERLEARIGAGQSGTFSILGLDDADEVQVIPSVLGETSSNKKEYICEKSVFDAVIA